MRNPPPLFAIMLLLASTFSRAETEATTEPVLVEGGMVIGVSAGGVVAFKGIPYAAPPLDALRWRAPQPVPPWDGVRKADAYGHDCMQVAIDDVAAPPGAPPAEDCLTLNVWRPAAPSPVGGYPVMAWIHGGGFVNGGASAAVYDGSALARRGLVVVSFNYRLGRLGFFAHPALRKAGEGPVGNFGHMDQIAALKWVKANIAALGGDPAKVTLVGESAGGASVVTLLTTAEARGLFRGAVVMSGGGRRALAARVMDGADMPATAASGDAAFARSLGIDGDGPEALAALRALPAASVIGDIALPLVLETAIVSGTTDVPGTPMRDGTMVVGEPEVVFRAGKQARVPVIVGTTAIDLPLFFPPRDQPFAMFGAEAPAAMAAFAAPGMEPAQIFLGIGADMTMHEPARFVARSVTAAGERAWLYRFSYVAQGVPGRIRGAAHAEEVPYLFGTVDARYGASTAPQDREMSGAFSAYVANFVRTGDPNGEGLPPWPRFDPAAFDVMDFALSGMPTFGPDPRAGRIGLVERAADAGR